MVNFSAITGTKNRKVGTYQMQYSTGEPQCPYLNEGIEFKDEETVYVENRNKNFRYQLRESDDGMEITFYNPSGDIDIYEIIIENKDKLALIGFGTGVSKNFNCYFEREK